MKFYLHKHRSYFFLKVRNVSGFFHQLTDVKLFAIESFTQRLVQLPTNLLLAQLVQVHLRHVTYFMPDQLLWLLWDGWASYMEYLVGQAKLPIAKHQWFLNTYNFLCNFCCFIVGACREFSDNLGIFWIHLHVWINLINWKRLARLFLFGKQRWYCLSINKFTQSDPLLVVLVVELFAGAILK